MLDRIIRESERQLQKILPIRFSEIITFPGITAMKALRIFDAGQ